jgi:hypothetical protein
MKRYKIFIAFVCCFLSLCLNPALVLSGNASETETLPAESSNASQIEAKKTVMRVENEVPWGEPLNGLRMRLTTPKGTMYSRGTSLPLVIEIQNVSDQPFPLKQLNSILQFKVTDQQNQRIGIQGILDGHITNWESLDGVLKPDEIITDTCYIERLKWRMSSTAESIVMHFLLPTQKEGPEKFTITEYSNPVTIQLKDSPYEHLLKSQDLPEKWTEDIDIVYREMGGIFMGSMAMHIDGKGRATIIGYKSPRKPELQIPIGRYEYVLEYSELNKLIKSLREFKIERLNEYEDKMYATDLMDICFSLAKAGQTFVGKYEVFEPKTEPVVALQTLMRQFITKIVAESKKVIVQPEIKQAETNVPDEPNEEMVNIALERVSSLKDIFEILSKWTGKKIVAEGREESLRISIYATRKVTKSQAIKMVYAAIKENGYTVEETEEIIYIKPNSAAQK